MAFKDNTKVPEAFSFELYLLKILWRSGMKRQRTVGDEKIYQTYIKEKNKKWTNTFICFEMLYKRQDYKAYSE